MKFIIVFLSLVIISCPTQSKNQKSIPKEQWMGIYLKQGKIGYSFSQIQRIKDYYKMTNRVKMNLAMMGQPEKIVSNFTGTTDTNFSLHSFEFSFQSQKNSFSARGSIKDNLFSIEVKSGGVVKKETREVDSENLYPVMTLGNVAIKRRFQNGKEYIVKVFDATVLSVVDAKLTVLTKEQMLISGKNYNLTKLNVSMLGLTSVMWIDDDGIVRKQESPPALTEVEETQEQALSQEEAIGKLDILSLFSIPADTIIPFPRKLRYLKLRLVNSDYSGFNLMDDRQTILIKKPLTLEIRSLDTLPNVALPIFSADEFLKSSLCIQSDNAEIKKTVEKIVGKEKNGAKAVENITQWVFGNVKKSATASLPSAVDVLKNLEGDCNEHAVLFAALCRAAGVPAQICVGLVYVDGTFYYHAWNKVFLGRWVQVDPTFGQFPVDATHIKFTEGELEEQAKVLKIVGEIKIKILEFH